MADNADGYCWAKNKHFADNLGVQSRQVQIYLSELRAHDYIECSEDSDKKGDRQIYINANFLDSSAVPQPEKAAPKVAKPAKIKAEKSPKETPKQADECSIESPNFSNFANGFLSFWLKTYGAPYILTDKDKAALIAICDYLSNFIESDYSSGAAVFFQKLPIFYANPVYFSLSKIATDIAIIAAQISTAGKDSKLNLSQSQAHLASDKHKASGVISEEEFELLVKVGKNAKLNERTGIEDFRQSYRKGWAHIMYLRTKNEYYQRPTCDKKYLMGISAEEDGDALILACKDILAETYCPVRLTSKMLSKPVETLLNDEYRAIIRRAANTKAINKNSSLTHKIALVENVYPTFCLRILNKVVPENCNWADIKNEPLAKEIFDAI